MIQLATDPKARNPGWQPAADGHAVPARPVRGGHAWPFPSRAPERSQPREASRTPTDPARR